MNLSTLPTRHSHHSPVLEHLASNRSSSNQKVAEALDLLLALESEARDLRVVAALPRRDFLQRKRLVGEGLRSVEVEETVDRGELSRARLQYFLSYDPSEGGAHGGENRGRSTATSEASRIKFDVKELELRSGDSGIYV